MLYGGTESRVDAHHVSRAFAGRSYDAALLAELPTDVDLAANVESSTPSAIGAGEWFRHSQQPVLL
jgi:hypothetical protein